MATRRVAASEKTHLDQHEVQQADKSNTSPAVPGHVIAKLLSFTFAMIVLPITSYFATVDLLFGGNSTYAGALAALVANVVLIGYIVVAFNEDQAERATEDLKKKL